MATAYTRDVSLEQAVRRLPSNGAHIKPHTAIALLLVAVAIWLVAIRLLRGATVGQYGLLATLGGAFLLAAAMVAIAAFVLAIATDRTLIAGVAIGVVTVIQRVTVTLITDVPIYTWTYKHIGIVDYIIRNRSLAPPNVNVYGAWPGFFAAMAWFSTVTGLDPVDTAHWFAPVAEAMTSVMVGALALSLGYSVRVALIAAMLTEILNWTGQDYYSPQAMGLFMAVAILALLAYSKKLPISGYISVPIFAVLVPTHQLTPVWLCILTICLVLFRQIRPRWLAPIYTVTLAIYVLPRREMIKDPLFSGFNIFKNGEVAATNRGSDGREFTILMERLLAVSVWLLAATCFVLIWRRIGAPWAIGIMAFSSMLVLGGQSYGGEAIIRVFLYSIAGCAVLLATAAARAFDPQPRKRKILAIITVMLLLAGFSAAAMQSYYGGWCYVTIDRRQLEQSRQLLSSNAGPPTFGIVVPQAGWPEQSDADYVRLYLEDPGYVTMLDELKRVLQHNNIATRQDVEQLENKASEGRTFYVVLPRQLAAYGEYFGSFTPRAFSSLIERLSESPGWIKVINDANTVVFAYNYNAGRQ
jgi:hypothetical protein